MFYFAHCPREPIPSIDNLVSSARVSATIIRLQTVITGHSDALTFCSMSSSITMKRVPRVLSTCTVHHHVCKIALPLTGKFALRLGTHRAEGRGRRFGSHSTLSLWWTVSPHNLFIWWLMVAVCQHRPRYKWRSRAMGSESQQLPDQI